MYNTTIQDLPVTLILAPVLEIYDYHRYQQWMLQVNTDT